MVAAGVIDIVVIGTTFALKVAPALVAGTLMMNCVSGILERISHKAKVAWK
jgi:hypothetical protein